MNPITGLTPSPVHVADYTRLPAGTRCGCLLVSVPLDRRASLEQFAGIPDCDRCLGCDRAIRHPRKVA